MMTNYAIDIEHEIPNTISELEFYVSEIFYSIQGEGKRAGERCVFIRLQGCTLRCVWCDTKYALDHRKGGITMTGKEIIEQALSYDCPFIEFTGGEPLEQNNVLPLMSWFCDKGYTVAVETGGHIDTSNVDERVIRIIDMKCPDSKMVTLNNYKNLTMLRKHDEVKFVINSETDYNWAKGIVTDYNLPTSCSAVLFSPTFNSIDYQEFVRWILRDKLDVKFQLQLHKFIWEPTTRGV